MKLLLAILCLLTLSGCGAYVKGKGGDNTITHSSEISPPTTTHRSLEWRGSPLTEEEIKFFTRPSGARK